MKDIKVDFEKLRSLPPIERVYQLLAIVKANNDYYEKVDNLSYKYIEEDASKYILYKSVTYKYREVLLSEFSKVSEVIMDSYFLNDIKQISSESISIINNEIFPISVMLLPFERWKSIINYELEILGNKSLMQLTLRKFNAQLKDLEYRLNSDLIPQLGFYTLEFYENEFDYLYTISPPFKISDFNQSLSKHFKYLKDINIDDLSKKSLKRTINKIQKDDDLKSLLKKMQITLSSNITQIVLLKLCSSFFNKHLKKIEPYPFVIHIFKYKIEVPESYYLKKNQRFKTQSLNNEELLDLISFLKYLLEKKIIDNNLTAIARSIKYFYPNVEIREQSIRKKLSISSNVNLASAIKKELNYYLL